MQPGMWSRCLMACLRTVGVDGESNELKVSLHIGYS